MNQERFSKLQGVIGLSTLGIVLVSALALGANRPVSWSLLAIAVTGIFALQALVSLAGPAPVAVRRALWPGFFILLGVGWGWLQVLPGLPKALMHPVWQFVPEATAYISADPGASRHAVMRMMCYVLVFVILLWTCVKPQRAEIALRMIAIFSTALAAYGLYSFTTGTNIILGDYTNAGIVQASFVNRNSYATYAIFGALANIACYLQIADNSDDSLRGRLEGFFSGAWIFALGILLCIGAVSLTQSRAGAGAGLVGLLVFWLSWRSNKSGSDRVAVAAMVATLLFIGSTSATGLLERLISTDASDARFAIYPAIWQAIFDRPLLGHGAGTFYDAFRPYVPLEAAPREWARAHSTYLELAFGLGLPAAGAFLIGQAMIAARLWSGARKRRKDRIYTCFALGCVGAAGFHALFDFSLQMPATAALYAAILAIGYAQSFTFRERAVDAPARRRKPKD